jgi:hypothetical protein
LQITLKQVLTILVYGQKLALQLLGATLTDTLSVLCLSSEVFVAVNSAFSTLRLLRFPPVVKTTAGFQARLAVCCEGTNKSPTKELAFEEGMMMRVQRKSI